MKLLIDCNNLCYMAYYTTGQLAVDEIKTGVIFGFLKKINKLADVLKTNEIIFCWDSRKSYRKLRK